MTKETTNIIKSITASEKAYREQLINLVFDLIDSALNRHNEDEGKILLCSKVFLVEKKVRGGNFASMDVHVAEYVYYNKETSDIQVWGENDEYENDFIGNFYSMPIGMVEEVVKAIIKTAKSE